jgi:hypothetical protein
MKIDPSNLFRHDSEQSTDGIFVPSKEWQVIPDGVTLPNGGEYRFNQNTGLNYARWDDPPTEAVRYKTNGKYRAVNEQKERADAQTVDPKTNTRKQR